jgi:hypothetical protein
MWELVAREHIRDTLARYNWSGDAGRLDDLADIFCVDGVLEIRGFDPLRGRPEIVEFLGGVTGSTPSAPTSSRSCGTTSPTCSSPRSRQITQR